MKKHCSYSLFARVPHGLEEQCAYLLAKFSAAEELISAHRTISFKTKNDLHSLIELPFVEDLFIELHRYSGLDHTRRTLSLLAEAIAPEKVEEVLEQIRGIRNIAEKPSFSISASFLGKRNYNRWELADEIRKGLQSSSLGEYQDPRQVLENPDIHFRLHLEGDSAILGVRLADHPLYKRPYKTAHVPGSLNPVIAFYMLALAGVQDDSILLDPCCGSGTIPLESHFSAKGVLPCPRLSLGCDLDCTIVEKALSNQSARTQPAASFYCADAQSLPLATSSVSHIVSDLPWGSQTELENKEGDLPALLKEFKRVLTKNSVLCLLYEDSERLIEAAQDCGFSINKKLEISVYGRHPTIHRLIKR